MTEQDALDAALDVAAKATGHGSWTNIFAITYPEHVLRRSVEAHANEILARQASDKALADFRKEVSEFAIGAKEYMRCAGALGWQEECDRFIIPAPDPLVEALSEAMCGIPGEDYTQSAEDLRNVLAKYGLKLERIDQ